MAMTFADAMTQCGFSDAQIHALSNQGVMEPNLLALLDETSLTELFS